LVEYRLIASSIVTLALVGLCYYMKVERLARAGTSPTRSGPEGSSRNEPRLGRCPASHLIKAIVD